MTDNTLAIILVIFPAVFSAGALGFDFGKDSVEVPVVNSMHLVYKGVVYKREIIYEGFGDAGNNP